jgi:DNA-directed RNA polymerase subunit L
MKVSFGKKDDVLEVTMVGEDHSFPNLLRETLAQDEDVEFVSYRIDHPQIGSPKLVIKAGKKPEKALSEAIKKVRKLVEAFESALEKVKEEKPEKAHKEKKKK